MSILSAEKTRSINKLTDLMGADIPPIVSIHSGYGFEETNESIIKDAFDAKNTLYQMTFKDGGESVILHSRFNSFIDIRAVGAIEAKFGKEIAFFKALL